MKKILVTGATGFIGHHVIKALLAQEYEVIATSLNPEKAKLQAWFNQVTYIAFDLSSVDNDIDYFKFFGQPDFMIHLAWEGLPNYKEAFHINENLPRHFSFLRNMISNGLQDLTVTGTCFEYGMKEGCLDETMLCEPGNPYAVAKNQLRIQLEKLAEQYSFNFRWLRLFYMFGEGQNAKSLLSQLDKALKNNDSIFNMSGGEQVRDFLPVEKMAEYIVALAAQQSITGVINCCSGNPVTVKHFVEEYLRRHNKRIALNLGFYPYPDYEPMRFWGSDKKLRLVVAP